MASSFFKWYHRAGGGGAALRAQRGTESDVRGLAEPECWRGLSKIFTEDFRATRTAVSRCGCVSSTLSPRMIRGDKVAVAHFQSVTAIRGKGEKGG